MESVEQSLLSKLAKVKKYLEARVEHESAYQELISKIDNVAIELTQHKPRIKLVSDDINLSRTLKRISINDLSLNQHYQFHVVPLDGVVENIIQDCELILLLYNHNSLISARDKQIIEAAIAQNIDSKAIVISQKNESIEPDKAINHWLEIQNQKVNSNILWFTEKLLVLECANSLQQYQSYIKQKNIIAKVKLQERYTTKITRIVNQQIEALNKATWQVTKTEKEQWLEKNPPEVFRQKLHKRITQVNKLQQQSLLKIKQKIQHNRSNLNNPFLENNLFCQTQQIIQNAEVNIIKVEQQNYLVGMVKTKNSWKPLHLYLTNIYQQQFQSEIEKQWKDCEHSYGEGGLNQLRQDIQAKLQPFTHFGAEAGTVTALNLKSPNFDLNNLIYIPVLAEGSRIPFEYSFNQSQWFKILVAGGVGVAIFLITQLFSGQGRFFGFFILIFQFISLFTGQDIKTLKIKQHTKELKRILDNKYQILIRLSAEKITQDLIVALDREQQHYQQQIDEISQTANERISAIKERLERHKEQINVRKQDLQAILQMLK